LGSAEGRKAKLAPEPTKLAEPTSNVDYLTPVQALARVRWLHRWVAAGL
jgi:hypothetical protein